VHGVSSGGPPATAARCRCRLLSGLLLLLACCCCLLLLLACAAYLLLLLLLLLSLGRMGHYRLVLPVVRGGANPQELQQR